MRFQRLLLEAGTSTVTVDLHPRLTIIAGVGELERESLVTELLGGLSGARPGTHVEIVEDSGLRLGVMHPTNGTRDRVVELDTGNDVTGDYLDDQGEVDLLAPLGFDLRAAKRRCRMASADMVTEATLDVTVARLAGADQTELWPAAEAVRLTDARLKSEVSAAGVNPEDAPLVEEIERRHAAFEAAQERLEYVRHHGIFVGGACVAGAVPAVALKHWVAAPLLAIAIATTVLSIVFRRRMEKTRRAERRVLDEAGAESYLAFRLMQMNTMFDGGADRRGLADAVAAHRDALARWHRLAGEISTDLAFDLQARVAAAANRIREAGGPSDPGPATAEPAELAQALIVRMNDLRSAGNRGESLPLLLDEPLAGVSPSVKQWVLELVGRSAGSPQIVYLTNDPDVAAWGRMEAVSGEVTIIEPAPAQESSGLR